MTIQRTRNGDVEIAYETTGPAHGEPILLVMGISGTIASWPEGFCQLLADHGFQLARFDNRDAGGSTHFTGTGRPNQLTMWLRPGKAALYRLEDMADDAVAVLDALGWDSAHVLGFSEGGMIAQVMATIHPDRVRSLISVSSSPAPRLAQPTPRTLLQLAKVAKVAGRVKTSEDMAQYIVDLQSLVGSPAYPADESELRASGRRNFDYGGFDLASAQRQTAAIVASGDRRSALATIKLPTLVLHGEDDRMVLVKGGKATAEAIPGAKLVTYPGMGHELPRQLWPSFLEEITALTNEAITPKAGGNLRSTDAVENRRK